MSFISFKPIKPGMIIIATLMTSLAGFSILQGQNEIALLISGGLVASIKDLASSD